MTRKVLLALAALWSLPAAAQVYNNTLPVTCISAGNCIAATPVSNPDGTAIGAGGGGSVPTGTAGTPNASVVTVQGITGGTPQPISATALPLPAGAATAANQATMAANQTATGASAQTVQGADTAGATAAARPMMMGVLSGTGTIERARDAGGSSGSTGSGLLGVGVLGKFTTTLSTFTDAQYGVLSMDARGNLGVFLKGTIGSGGDGLANTNFASMGAFSDSSATGTIRLSASAASVFNGTTWDRARGDTTGAWVGGHTALATGQVSVGTTATLVAAARTGRQKIGVTVTSAVQCAFGNTGVTLTTGWPLAAVAYASDSWDTAAALYAVCASTATVGYREQY